MEKKCKKCGVEGDTKFWLESEYRDTDSVFNAKYICKLCGTELTVDIVDAGKTIPCAAPPPATKPGVLQYPQTKVPIPCEHGYYRSCCICHLKLSKDEIEELEKAIDTIFGVCVKHSLYPEVVIPDISGLHNVIKHYITGPSEI